MITQKDYQVALGQIGKKFQNVNINWHSWYLQYSYYESMWNNYLEAFISTYSHIVNPKDIRFIFWESCPGGMPFPHQNYAFDSNRFQNPLHGTFDKYLKNECETIEITWKNNNIGQLINLLSSNGILIIDLYPTHGIDLNSKKNATRLRLFNKLFESYSITKKLSRIGTETMGFAKSNEIKVTSELWNAGINNNMNPALKNKVQEALGISSSPNFYT